MIGGDNSKTRALKVSAANISEVELLPDTLEARSHHSACWLGEASIVLTGGSLDSKRIKSTKSCEVFDLEIMKWKPLPDLNQKRSHHSSVAFNNKIVYVFCGYDNTDLSSIERWVVGEEKWTNIKTIGDDLGMMSFHRSVQIDE